MTSVLASMALMPSTITRLSERGKPQYYASNSEKLLAEVREQLKDMLPGAVHDAAPTIIAALENVQRVALSTGRTLNAEILGKGIAELRRELSLPKAARKPPAAPPKPRRLPEPKPIDLGRGGNVRQSDALDAFSHAGTRAAASATSQSKDTDEELELRAAFRIRESAAEGAKIVLKELERCAEPPSTWLNPLTINPEKYLSLTFSGVGRNSFVFFGEPGATTGGIMMPGKGGDQIWYSVTLTPDPARPLGLTPLEFAKAALVEFLASEGGRRVDVNELKRPQT